MTERPRNIPEKLIHADALDALAENLSYFGNPPLFHDAFRALLARRTKDVEVLPTQLEPDDVQIRLGFSDYTSETNRPSHFLFLGKEEPEDPEIYLGFSTTGVREIDLRWARTNRWPDSERDITQETTLTFFGLKGGADPVLKRYYETTESRHAGIQLPRFGAFVDFRTTENSDPLTRLCGVVHENGPRGWVLHGYSLDRGIVSFGPHIEPGEQFGVSVRDTVLQPALRTLTPDFYRHDLPKAFR